MSASSTVRTGPVVSGLLARLQEDRLRASRLRRVGHLPADTDAAQHEDQKPFGGGSITQRLNWLRAGVLGANDGIVSISGLLVGVAAADPANTTAIAIAGTAGIVSAALSMSVGEFVSVSTQRDTERQLAVEKEVDLARDPAGELDRLASIWESKGLSSATARSVAEELSARDAVGAHLTTEHNIDPHDLTSPWAAALSSLVAFVAGSLLPFLTMLALGPSVRIPATIVAVLVALAVTGWVSAWLGEAPRTRAVLRLLVGGSAALALTYGIGHVFGVSA
jgi:VIT1/CCC1 family predicted Fe2+/Mn2+ transporter